MTIMNTRLDPLEYYTEKDWSAMMAEAKKYETPFLLVNLGIIRQRYQQLKELFPYAVVHYAVKANPSQPVLELLQGLGSNFDVASINELDSLLALGVLPDRISYGNTIKKRAHVEYAYAKGIRLFASDSEVDIRNLASAAPGSGIFLRILAEHSSTADWPLSKKFGCHPDMAIDLLMLANKLGLKAKGVSFHVGSQQREIGAWDSSISRAKYIFDYLEAEKIPLSLINMGGGFPASYISRTPEMSTYASELNRYLSEDFGENLPHIILEPGRSLVADAGILVTEVVLISKKSSFGVDTWLYTDAGKFNGLMETMEESIKYPLFCESAGRLVEDFIIAGPTCDSQDIMYETFRNPLPRHIDIGDRIYWLTAGAYTSSYSSVGFNGFPPIASHFMES
jgi:ornithine decarboxylase